MCEKLHAFRSPLLKLATSGAGDLMKNMIHKFISVAPVNYSWFHLKLTPGWVKMFLYLLTFDFPKWDSLKTLLPWKVNGSQWLNFHFVIPMAFICITCLGLEFGTSFRWIWGAAILLYMYRMVGWEAFVTFVTNLEYLFQLPPKLLLSWVCFPWGREVDCLMSKKY